MKPYKISTPTFRKMQDFLPPRYHSILAQHPTDLARAITAIEDQIEYDLIDKVINNKVYIINLSKQLKVIRRNLELKIK
jgi:hypothetical protein